ncbi:MAG: hypothetical protein O7C59_08675 [Rickettsia endosymbiont of Ixodes persulcatus]|nr:hypothetical protein [Rickettsia endosymbiont of Ixodes persulcatus]
MLKIAIKKNSHNQPKQKLHEAHTPHAANNTNITALIKKHHPHFITNLHTPITHTSSPISTNPSSQPSTTTTTTTSQSTPSPTTYQKNSSTTTFKYTTKNSHNQPKHNKPNIHINNNNQKLHEAHTPHAANKHQHKQQQQHQ